jgi:predicted metal-binding membrane protein
MCAPAPTTGVLPRLLLVAMALFVVVGVTNLAAMVVLAAVVLAEKLWVHGELLARLVGVAALALAVAVIWVPALAQDSTRPAR